MATELTDPDSDDLLEFTHTVEDPDGDSLSITLELDQIDGTEQSGSDRNPSWLSFTTSANNSTPNVVDVAVEIDKTQLGSAGTIYTFEAIADDGFKTTADTFTLEIVSGASATPDTGDVLYQYATSDDVRPWGLGTAFDLSSGLTNQTSKIFNWNDSLNDGHINKAGDKMLLEWRDSARNYDSFLNEFNLSTAGDPSSATEVNEVNLSSSISSKTNRARGIFFNADDTKMIVVDGDTNELHEYSFGTALDTSTLSFVQTVGIPSAASANLIWGGTFNKNLSKIYITDRGNNDLLQFSLSTPGDISTISFDKKIDLSGQMDSPAGITTNDDVSKIFLSERGGDENFYEYVLSTPGDIGSASFETQKPGNTAGGLQFL